MGHTKARCKQPLVEEEAADGGYGGDEVAADAGDYGAGDAADDEYTAPVESSGGGGW